MTDLWFFCAWANLPRFWAVFTSDPRFQLAGGVSDFANPPGDREAQAAVINAGDVVPNADDFVEQLDIRVKVDSRAEVDGVIVILPPPWRHIAGTVRAMHGVGAVFVGAPTAEQLTEAAAMVKRDSPPVALSLIGGPSEPPLARVRRPPSASPRFQWDTTRRRAAGFCRNTYLWRCSMTATLTLPFALMAGLGVFLFVDALRPRRARANTIGSLPNDRPRAGV